MSNDPKFVKSNPQCIKGIKEIYRISKPEECEECVCFHWLYGEDRRISGGQCGIAPDIRPEKFEYGIVAEGCPLMEQNEYLNAECEVEIA